MQPGEIALDTSYRRGDAVQRSGDFQNKSVNFVKVHQKQAHHNGMICYGGLNIKCTNIKLEL